MLLNVTLLWLLLKVMRMWMFSTGKTLKFVSTLRERKKKSLFYFFFLAHMCWLCQWLRHLLLLFHFKTDG